MPTVDLNNVPAIRATDSGGMLGYVAGLPDQLDDAWARALAFELPASYRAGEIKHVVGLGTGGGSRFVLGLARSLLEEELPLDFVIRQGYQLPTAVGPDSLVFALSHSGNTLETVATTEQAIRRRARLVVVTAGGRLLQLAEEHRLPHVRHADRRIMPRAAVGMLLAPLLRSLHLLDLIADKSDALFNLIGYLRQIRHAFALERPEPENPAKALARFCLGGTPLIFHSAYTEAVADRLTRQLAENGKLWSATESLPEAHHDKIVGLLGGAGGRYRVVFLRSAWETAELERRFEATRELLLGQRLVERVYELRVQGSDRWEETFHALMLVDFASCYAAIARGIDPTPVPVIDELKRLLGQGG